MTQPLTPARIAEMRARCEAATPGPWEEFRGGIRIGSEQLDWTNEEYGYDGNAEFIVHARTDMPALLDEVVLLTRERDEANAQIRADEEGRVAWCRECGRVSSCDEDRCCSMCGYDLIVLADLHSAEVLEDYINERDERDEARAEIERLRSAADRTKDAWDRDVAELHAAREEIERLRAARDEARRPPGGNPRGPFTYEEDDNG